MSTTYIPAADGRSVTIQNPTPDGIQLTLVDTINNQVVYILLNEGQAKEVARALHQPRRRWDDDA